MLELRHVTVQTVGELAAEMEAQDISTTLWSLIELRETSPELIKLIPVLLRAFADISPARMKPRHIATALWGSAKVCENLPEVAAIGSAVTKIVCKVHGTFSERDCSNILWALGMLRAEQSLTDPALRQICKQARSVAASFSHLVDLQW